ncbi:hypothetical protein [Streptomyces sp. NPDC054765]
MCAIRVTYFATAINYFATTVNRGLLQAPRTARVSLRAGLTGLRSVEKRLDLDDVVDGLLRDVQIMYPGETGGEGEADADGPDGGVPSSAPRATRSATTTSPACPRSSTGT